METKNITTLPPTTDKPNVDLEKFVLSSMLPIRAVKAPCFSYGDETAQFFIAFYKKIELY